MSNHELYLAFRYTYATLTSSSDLMALVTGVYRDVAPDKAIPPFVVFGFQSGIDSNTMNGKRVLTRPLVLAKVIGPSTMSETVAQAAAIVDDLLTPDEAPGNGIDYSYRESPFAQGEPPVNGISWFALGGLYRMGIEKQ